MPLLSRRHAPPLLRTVKLKQHATQDDHADALPTPPSTNGKPSYTSVEEEDLNREPYDSSEDERPGFLLPAVAMNNEAAASKPAAFAMPRQIDGTRDEAITAPTFKQPATLPPKKIESNKLKTFVLPNSEDDLSIFHDRPHKRQKKAGVSNLFATPKKEIGYGKKARNSLQNNSANLAKVPKATKAKILDIAPPRPEFKQARGVELFELGTTEPLAQFQAPRSATTFDQENYERPLSRSSSLSSLSEPPSDIEVAKGGHRLPMPRDYKPECAICREPVSVLLKEEFENRYTNSKTMLSYKWQQRFCRWHKEQEAKRIREDKGYPEVDWSRLERRMRKHHGHLKDVLSGSKRSSYRDQLSEKIKERSKTAMQVLSKDGATRGASVGYYGPRGERLMTEHIINHLSDQLRVQSAKDKLVAAAGVSGGVSGFIQAVLVPELAEQLVMEDLKVASQKARDIIAESTELGELLYPDVDDKVLEAVEL